MDAAAERGYLDVVHEYLPLQMAEYDRWMNREKTL